MTAHEMFITHGELDTLCWPLREPGMQVVCRYTCRPKIHTHKKKKLGPVATLEPSNWEIEMEESQVPRQAGLKSENLSQKTER